MIALHEYRTTGNTKFLEPLNRYKDSFKRIKDEYYLGYIKILHEEKSKGIERIHDLFDENPNQISYILNGGNLLNIAELSNMNFSVEYHNPTYEYWKKYIFKDPSNNNYQSVRI